MQAALPAQGLQWLQLQWASCACYGCPQHQRQGPCTQVHAPASGHAGRPGYADASAQPAQACPASVAFVAWPVLETWSGLYSSQGVLACSQRWCTAVGSTEALRRCDSAGQSRRVTLGLTPAAGSSRKRRQLATRRFQTGPDVPNFDSALGARPVSLVPFWAEGGSAPHCHEEI